ncbi:MAG: membrane protein insertion efficiency factor YidD [Candidatus Sumerlaeaceae bacterium]|nr:membrane protein insertion efficiency factor YidD [Candidatus Sumerlaeaceae bacterium]
MTIARRIEWPFRILCVGLVRGYQICVSPLLPSCCRFYPSCSHYALEALQKKPLFTALRMIAWRIARCNPLCKGGYDPVE